MGDVHIAPETHALSTGVSTELVVRCGGGARSGVIDGAAGGRHSERVDELAPSVARLRSLGPMPSGTGADEDTVRGCEEALSGLPAVPTPAEVAALLDVFPASDDTLFGAARTLLHDVEEAPGWPYESMLSRPGAGPGGRARRGSGVRAPTGRR